MADKFLPGDGLLFVEELGRLVQLVPVLGKDLQSLGVLGLYQLHHLLVDLVAGSGQSRPGRCPLPGTGCSLVSRATMSKSWLIPCRVIRSPGAARWPARCHWTAPVVTEWSTSSSAARPPGKGGDLVVQLRLVHQVVVALVHLHGIAQGTGGPGDDGDLWHRRQQWDCWRRCQRSPSSPGPPVPWAIPCRWTRATTT